MWIRYSLHRTLLLTELCCSGYRTPQPEALPLILLSTGWFQEQIQMWFKSVDLPLHNRTKINKLLFSKPKQKCMSLQ